MGFHHSSGGTFLSSGPEVPLQRRPYPSLAAPTAPPSPGSVLQSRKGRQGYGMGTLNTSGTEGCSRTRRGVPPSCSSVLHGVLYPCPPVRKSPWNSVRPFFLRRSDFSSDPRRETQAPRKPSRTGLGPPPVPQGPKVGSHAHRGVSPLLKGVHCPVLRSERPKVPLKLRPVPFFRRSGFSSDPRRGFPFTEKSYGT